MSMYFVTAVTRRIGNEGKKNDKLHLCLNYVGFLTAERWIPGAIPIYTSWFPILI